ncbi:acyl carrier protein [Hymenobacter volaticus]|uniref:Acyl carrier protein n=1 Tax=Hymenobacter volaticus TaxID=2932254 RepID=A0ABY4GG39_9BACT|nr:acyl carrier protein [Hymenobacter volaticus]UOQ69945.1 acyl carrier protein [Hymenobacter volaticus]
MRATSWRDTIWQLAVRLLPPRSIEQLPPSAGQPNLGLDALDFVELIQQIEQHFNFRFSAEQLQDLRTAQLVLSSASPRRRRQLYAEFFAQLMQQGDWLDW